MCALACLLLVAACASNANHKAPDKIDEAMLVRLGDDSLKSGDAATAASFSILPQQSTSGNFIKVAQVVPVKITIDSPGNLILIPGTSVEVKINTKN